MVRVSGLPLATRDSMRLGNLQRRADVKGLGPALALARLMAEGKSDFTILTFAGAVGLGKTHMALGIAWDWVERGQYVIYNQVEGLLDDLRGRFERAAKGHLHENDVTFGQRWGQIMDCNLLVLDDFGAEKLTDWALAKLDALVDYRYLNNLHMVVSSNLDKAKLPPRIADRLIDTRKSRFVIFEGGSYRAIKGPEKVS